MTMACKFIGARKLATGPPRVNSFFPSLPPAFLLPGASLRESLERERPNLKLDLSAVSLLIQGFQTRAGRGTAAGRVHPPVDYTKNGLFVFSSPTVVTGPCPGQIKVSGGREKT